MVPLRVMVSRASLSLALFGGACSAGTETDPTEPELLDTGRVRPSDRPSTGDQGAQDATADAPPPPLDGPSVTDGSGTNDLPVTPTDRPSTSDTGVTCGPREVCGDGRDNDCNGSVDDHCACAPGATQECSTGDPSRHGVGACRAGSQTCEGTGEFGAWTPCQGEVLPRAEACDNGLDDDCDGMRDEGCTPCITGMASGSPWQMHRVMGPICFGRTFSSHGEIGEYDFATVPSETDSGWRPVTETTIDFSQVSALCGRSCDCRNGGEFTYFQTFFEVPAGYTVTDLSVTMGRVDDGARVSIYNSRFPSGRVEAGSYVYLGGSGTSTNLAPFVATGRNRVLITHLDDCCSERYLTGVRVVINGRAAGDCGP